MLESTKTSETLEVVVKKNSEDVSMDEIFFGHRRHPRSTDSFRKAIGSLKKCMEDSGYEVPGKLMVTLNGKNPSILVNEMPYETGQTGRESMDRAIRDIIAFITLSSPIRPQPLGYGRMRFITPYTAYQPF